MKGNKMEKIEFQTVSNNANGHPRYVCHFLSLLTQKESNDDKLSISDKYAIALYRAKAIGGKKYHNRKYGGGIAFATFNLESKERQIKEAIAEATRKESLDVNGNPIITPGDVLTCSETGKQFVAANVGCTTNYARDREGNIYSDEGVNIRESRELLDRSKPFYCYLSSDGKTVGGWKGNVLGRVIVETYGGGFGSNRRTHKGMVHIRVKDIHGGEWYGKGAGRGMCITLRACKS